MERNFSVTSLLSLLVVIAFITFSYWLSAPENEPIQVDLIVAMGGGTGERDQMVTVEKVSIKSVRSIYI